jgi:hypothetical protein
LIDQILGATPERTLFVTFNYDTLIEDALGIHGVKFDHLEAYINRDPRFALYKLHGSVDWARLHYVGANNRDSRHQLIDKAGQLQEPQQGTGYRIWHSIDTDLREGGLVGLPAIAIPLQQKTTFECPQEHISHLAEQLPKVRKILAIGWRGMEQHFTSLLKERLGNAMQKLHVVSKGEGDATMKHLKIAAQLNRAECTCADHGFSAFVSDRLGRAFFAT